MRAAITTLIGLAILIMAVSIIFSMSIGFEIDLRKSLGSDYLLVPLSGVLVTATGVRVGDTIELLTPSGKQAYQVVAMAGDYLNAKIATVYISQANLAKDFGRDEDVFLQFNLSPGADRTKVEWDIKEILLSYPQFRLINGQGFRDSSRRT
jgi:putative ABC transport system permease protein